jgi:hypothetical protein
MVYENQHLLDIDKADFADVFMMLGYDESCIEHHISLDFVCKDGELAIIDEAGRPMLRDSSAFKLFAFKFYLNSTPIVLLFLDP